MEEEGKCLENNTEKMKLESEVKIKLAYGTVFFCFVINHHESQRAFDICLRKTAIWGIQIVRRLFQGKSKALSEDPILIHPLSCINPCQSLHKFNGVNTGLQQRQLPRCILGINAFMA